MKFSKGSYKKVEISQLLPISSEDKTWTSIYISERFKVN